MSSTEDIFEKVPLHFRLMVLVFSVVVVISLSISLHGKTIDRASYVPLVNFSFCRFVRGSNYTDSSEIGEKFSTAILKLATAVVGFSFAVKILFSISGCGGTSTFCKQIAKNTPGHRNFTILLGMLVFANQVSPVGSMGQANSSHAMCYPGEEPVYQCFEPPEPDFCPTGIIVEQAFKLPPKIVDVIIRSSPKHLVSLTYVKTPYKIHTATQSEFVVIILCVVVSFIGPGSPILLLIGIPALQYVANVLYFQVVDRLARVLWNNHALIWVLEHAKGATDYALNTVNLTSFGFLLYTKPFILLSILSISVALYGEALNSALPSLATHLLACILWVFAFVMAEKCGIWLHVCEGWMVYLLGRIQDFATNGAVWLFGEAVHAFQRHFKLFLLSYLALVCMYACMSMYGEAFSAALFFIPPCMLFSVLVFVPVINAFRDCLLVNHVPCPYGHNYLPLDIAQPSIWSKPCPNLHQVGKGCLVYRKLSPEEDLHGTLQACHTSMMPSFFVSSLLWKHRERLHCLPDDYKAVVVNGVSVTSVGETDELDQGSGIDYGTSSTVTEGWINHCPDLLIDLEDGVDPISLAGTGEAVKYGSAWLAHLDQSPACIFNPYAPITAMAGQESSQVLWDVSDTNCGYFEGEPNPSPVQETHQVHSASRLVVGI